ncbi:MAG: hypothetical protein M9887_08595 [Chitinophagales bacterium]|nr:hypothetical protein [Chitinophagales bacterium]
MLADREKSSDQVEKLLWKVHNLFLLAINKKRKRQTQVGMPSHSSYLEECEGNDI